MPRLRSLVIGRASWGASLGPTQTLSTPSTGAGHASRWPSGLIRAEILLGLPNKCALGIRMCGMSHSSLVAKVHLCARRKTEDEECPLLAWTADRTGCRRFEHIGPSE